METMEKIQQIRQKALSMVLTHEKIMVSVSGGSDSDILMHIMVDAMNVSGKEIIFVFFDTGLEYKASKEHLEYLEQKYNIEIKRVKPKITATNAIINYGQPFKSKHISDMISRLQKHGFDWVDEPYEILKEKYPKCLGGLKWWTNNNGEGSHFNINKTKYLKEFMVMYPPTFKVSDKCCKFAKKDVAKNSLVEYEIDLNVIGVRKSEGGRRATTYKSCFIDGKVGQYMPILFLSDEEKAVYSKHYNIKYSDCYEVYGLKRTGCIGCPFGSKFEEELKIAEQYEPKTAETVKNIFKDSYAYARAFKKFKEPFKKEVKQGQQISMEI